MGSFFFSPQRQTNVTLAAVERDSSWSWPPGGRQPGTGSSPTLVLCLAELLLGPSGQSGEKVPVPVIFYVSRIKANRPNQRRRKEKFCSAALIGQ